MVRAMFRASDPPSSPDNQNIVDIENADSSDVKIAIIQFPINSIIPDDDAIDVIAEISQKLPGAKIKLVGHASSSGSETFQVVVASGNTTVGGTLDVTAKVTASAALEVDERELRIGPVLRDRAQLLLDLQLLQRRVGDVLDVLVELEQVGLEQGRRGPQGVGRQDLPATRKTHEVTR